MSHANWVAVSRELARWTLIALPVGIVAGLGAAAFYFLGNASTAVFLGGIVAIGYPYAGAPAGGLVVWSSSFPGIHLLRAVMVVGGAPDRAHRRAMVPGGRRPRER